MGAADESVAASRTQGESKRRAAIAPSKPATMEWDEWTGAFQNEPITIVDQECIPDDEPTSPDLSVSGVHVTNTSTLPPAPAPAEPVQAQNPERSRRRTRTGGQG